MLNHKADVNLQDDNGMTPLHLSCKTNRHQTTTVLLENGASTTIQDNDGECPLISEAANDSEVTPYIMNSMKFVVPLHFIS